MVFEPTGGGHISKAIEQAIAIADKAEQPVTLRFNGTDVLVHRSHSDQVYFNWLRKRPDGQDLT